MKQIVNDTFYRFQFLSRLQASPNEKRYGFVVAKPNKKDNIYDHSLYVAKDKPESVLELGTQADYLFVSDSEVLVKVDPNKKRREKDQKERRTRLSLFHVETKKLELVGSVPIPISFELRLSERKVIVSSVLKEADHILYEGTATERRKYLKEVEASSFSEDIEELPFLFNGADFIHGKRKQLFVLDLKTLSLTLLTPKDFGVSQVERGRTKDELLLSGNYQEAVRTPHSGLYSLSLKSQRPHLEVLLASNLYKIDRFFVQGNDVTVFASDMKNYGLNQSPDVYQLTTKGLSKISDYGYSVYSSVGSDCRYGGSPQAVQGTPAYTVTTHDDHTDLLEITPKGVSRIYEVPGSIDGIISYQGKFILIGLMGRSLQEVYELNGESLTQITSINQSALKGYYVAKPQVVEVRASTHTVKGWVLLPEDYDAKKKYPAILDIHGGPKTIYASVYYHEMQVWANAGYIVLYANPRGSDGKGDAFADIRGKYGAIDYEDLMNFTDAVIQKYAVDERKLFVTGGSYGGFMTNWMVGQTKRFKAGATQRSISNWVSFCGTSDIGHTFGVDQAGGHPVVDMKKLWDQSPLKYAMKVTTPLLFIHSDKDHRCPMEQAEQFHSVLKTNGVDTRFIWFKNENHELSRSGKPHARLKRLDEIEAWFARFV